MPLSVKHAFQTALPDDPTKDVSAVEWNQDHTLTGVLGIANGGTGTTSGAGGVVISDTPPVGAPDNSLWWESDSGLLYLRFNDGTSTQWVLAAPQPDMSAFASTAYVDNGDAVLQASIAAGDATVQANLTAGDALKVAKAGDTMTGDLSISKAYPAAYLRTTGTTTNSTIWGVKDSKNRWVIQMPDTAAETGSNVGSDWSLSYFTDADALTMALSVQRATGRLALSGDPTVALHAATKQYVDAQDTTQAALKVSKTGDTMSGALTPNVTGTINLGSAALRWGTIFTSDLSLNNGVGDWTIVEGEDELFIHNNKRGKTYKFVMVEVDPSRVPPKKT